MLTLNTLEKMAVLRVQAEGYLVSVLQEIGKDKPELDCACDMGKKAMISLDCMRILQVTLDPVAVGSRASCAAPPPSVRPEP